MLSLAFYQTRNPSQHTLEGLRLTLRHETILVHFDGCIQCVVCRVVFMLHDDSVLIILFPGVGFLKNTLKMLQAELDDPIQELG